MPVLGKTGADDSSFEYIQGGKQGRRSVALVVVGAPLRQTGTQRQNRLRPVECLNLALLIHAQNDRFVRWIQIKPHNVTQLSGKLWVVAELERFHSMWLQFVFIPDALHRGGTDLLRGRHRTHAPLASVFGKGLQ